MILHLVPGLQGVKELGSNETHSEYHGVSLTVDPWAGAHFCTMDLER